MASFVFLAQFSDALASPHEPKRGALKRQAFPNLALQVTLVIVAEQGWAIAEESKSRGAVADLVCVVNFALAFAGHRWGRLPLHGIAHLVE